MDEKMNHDEVSEEAIKIIDNKEKVEVEVEEPPKKSNPVKEVLNYIILIVAAFVLAQVIHRYVFTPVTVDGRSMKETLQNNDYVFLWRLGKIERFDVIVFERGNEALIKRVIGFPGDYVEVKDDTLYINGKSYEEPYLEKRKEIVNYTNNFTSSFTLEDVCQITDINCTKGGQTTIPDNYYLVLGDNRLESKDSRMIGLIPEDKVLGHAMYVLYPLDRIGKIE